MKPHLKRRILSKLRLLPMLIQILVVVFIILFLGTNLFNDTKYNIYQKVCGFTQKQGFIVKNTLFEGNVYLDKKLLDRAASNLKNKPIFCINLDDIKKHIEQDNWADNVTVRRILPDTIKVHIQERVAIAIWQYERKFYLIDKSGDLITTYKGIGFHDLFQIVGQEANLHAQNLLKDLDKYPTVKAHVKSAVRYSKRRWNLNFENFIVKMPAKGFSESYEYLYLLHKQDKLLGQNYKVIDLRNKQKFYIEKNK